MGSPLKQSARRNLELYRIADLMVKSGLSEDFADAAVQTAMEFEGVYDLMVLWRDEDDLPERDAAVADITDLIDDCQQQERVQKPAIRFDDLETIAAHIRHFKDNLRLHVDKNGGIQELARRTGMPQPSLSRFFSSTSMPRRSTLLKVAEALNLSAVEIATPWER